MIIEHKVEILRPLEDVFSIASNPGNLSHYDSSIVEVERATLGEIGVGMRYQLVAVQFGKRMNVDLEITAYEPNQNFAFRINSGPFPVETHYAFLSQDNTTIIIGRREPQPNGIWIVLVPLMSVPARRKFASELNKLKIYMEASTGRKDGS